MFDLNSVEEVSSGSKRMKPGIHEVTITGFEIMDSGSVKMSFSNKEGEEHVEIMSMSEKASRFTQMKLKHMGMRFTTEEKLATLKEPKQFEAFFVGKKLRIKLGGREVEKDGKVYLNAQLPLPRRDAPFAETVDINPTNLTFGGEDINRIIKKSSEDFESPSSTSDDLPF